MVVGRNDAPRLRRARVAALAATAGIALSGCGNSQPSAVKKPKPTPAASSATTTTAPDDPTADAGVTLPTTQGHVQGLVPNADGTAFFTAELVPSSMRGSTVHLSRYRADGQRVWTKPVGVEDSTAAADQPITATPDGGAAIATMPSTQPFGSSGSSDSSGSTDSTDSTDSSVSSDNTDGTSSSNAQIPITITKFSPDGTQEWAKAVPGFESDDSLAGPLASDPDGNIYVGGTGAFGQSLVFAVGTDGHIRWGWHEDNTDGGGVSAMAWNAVTNHLEVETGNGIVGQRITALSPSGSVEWSVGPASGEVPTLTTMSVMPDGSTLLTGVDLGAPTSMYVTVAVTRDGAMNPASETGLPALNAGPGTFVRAGARSLLVVSVLQVRPARQELVALDAAGTPQWTHPIEDTDLDGIATLANGQVVLATLSQLGRNHDVIRMVPAPSARTWAAASDSHTYPPPIDANRADEVACNAALDSHIDRTAVAPWFRARPMSASVGEVAYGSLIDKKWKPHGSFACLIDTSGTQPAVKEVRTASDDSAADQVNRYGG